MDELYNRCVGGKPCGRKSGGTLQVAGKAVRLQCKSQLHEGGKARPLGQKSIRLKYKSNKIIGHLDAQSCDLSHLLNQSYISKNWTCLLSYSQKQCGLRAN